MALDCAGIPVSGQILGARMAETGTSSQRLVLLSDMLYLLFGLENASRKQNFREKNKQMVSPDNRTKPPKGRRRMNKRIFSWLRQRDLGRSDDCYHV